MRQFKPGQLQTGSLYDISSSFALTASYLLGLDTGSLLLSQSFNTFTSSYYIDSASFDTRILNNSASIANLSSSFEIFSGSYNTGSFTGSYTGDGAGLYNIPSSGIVGLNLSQIASGSATASISPNGGLQVNTNVTATSFTGSLFGTSSWANNAVTASYIDAGFY